MKVKRYESDAMHQLDDLYGIQYDLRMIEMWTELAKDLPEPAKTPPQSPEALMRMAMTPGIVITYRRCFNKSTRLPYPQEVMDSVFERMAGKPVEYHHNLIAMADKYTAHSVSEYELVRTGVLIDPDSGDIGDIEGEQRRFQLSDERLFDIYQLAKALADALIEPILTVGGKVREEVKELSPTERIALPDVSVDLDAPIDPNTARIGREAYKRRVQRAQEELAAD